MTIDELINEYEKLYRHLRAETDGLSPLLYFYSGSELVMLKRKICCYNKYANECKIIYLLLSGIDEEVDNYDKLY